jgi:hypothetical protein
LRRILTRRRAKPEPSPPRTPPLPLPHQFPTIEAWTLAWAAHRIAHGAGGDGYPFGACLPLIGSIGLDSALAADGVIWIQSGDFMDAEVPWRHARPNERIALLISTARRRFPELAVLLPLRPADAIDCRQCEGKGVLFEAAWCWECSARGWTVAGLDTRLESAFDPG